MVKNIKWFWPAALLAAWATDFLFYGKAPGVSLVIWTFMVLAVGYLLSWRAGKKPSWRTLPLAALVLFFSAVPAFRTNGSTNLFSLMMVLGGLLLITATFLNGNWPWYRLVDYIEEFARVIWAGFSRPFMSFSNPQPPALDGQPAAKGFWQKAAPVLRGILIALPVLAVFAALFASADPVFSDGLQKLLNIERLPEYILRLIVILVIAFWLVGMYLHAIHPLKEAVRPDPSAAWMKPFLGFTESGILLGAVDLLFAIFVVLQVRYLFGGTANISETGFTYAEYARRGFGELVAVAVISLGLILILNTVTRIGSKVQNVMFKIGTTLLTILVVVILASSLQRLLLYEEAYGFSQLRTQTHVFIYWLGALILAAAVFGLLNQRGRFALALLVMTVGFVMTLAVLNVDGFIVRQNVQRAVQGEEFDLTYLSTLSDDAVPALVEMVQKPSLPEEVHQSLLAELACRSALQSANAPIPWQSFNFAGQTAEQLLNANASYWSQVQIEKDEYGNLFTILNGGTYYCQTGRGVD